MRRAKEISIIILILLAFVTVVWGIDGIYHYNTYSEMVEPGQLHTAKNTWVVIDATTSSGDEPNDLAVDERTYATVSAAAEGGDDEISIYGDSAAERIVMSSWNAVRFRCIGITDNGTATYQIYLGTLGIGGTDCELVKAGQLAFVVGTQVSTTSTYELADAVTVTAYCWSKSWGYSNPGSELVAEAKIDLMGADIIVAVPTTASADCKLIAKGY